VAQGLSIIPFKNIGNRTLWLRVTLLNATFFGMIASAPLWTNDHTFPQLPIARGFPVLHAPVDKLLFGAMLLSLIVAAWAYRQAVGFFLAASLFVYCEDENRGQPWMYMYWVMLLFTLFSEKTAITACRIGMSVVYLWSGIQKCNHRFFEVQPAFFVEPLTHWHLPKLFLDLTRWAVACAPFIEMGIGVALWSPKLRRGAIGAAMAVHGFSLLVLGPLGHNYNWVVWPWNLAMPALLWVLFAKGEYWARRVAEAVPSTVPKEEKPATKVKAPVKKAVSASATDGGLKQAFGELLKSKPALAIVVGYALLPILSYSGKWDSYFSFCLYSENSASANIFVTQAFADRLPPPMQKQVKKFSETYDPQHQGPLIFNSGGWGYEELHVPPISEPRNFASIYKALQTWAQQPEDLRMIVGQRSGPVIFYEGDSREYLTPQ
jgi:hypothetical protein